MKKPTLKQAVILQAVLAETLKAQQASMASAKAHANIPAPKPAVVVKNKTVKRPNATKVVK